MKTIKIANDEVVINQSRLKQLLEKERGNDAYVWATKRMADKARHVEARMVEGPAPATEHARASGYAMALTDFAQLVVDAPVMENKPT